MLTSAVEQKVTEHDHGNYIVIEDSGIWLSVDEDELTVGYELVHHHYNPAFEDITEAVDRLFHLLTCRVKTTYFFKGDFSYKHRVELELPNGTFEHLGAAMTWLIPFWKKTKKEVSFSKNLLERSTIEADIKRIKDMVLSQRKQ